MLTCTAPPAASTPCSFTRPQREPRAARPPRMGNQRCPCPALPFPRPCLHLFDPDTRGCLKGKELNLPVSMGVRVCERDSGFGTLLGLAKNALGFALLLGAGPKQVSHVSLSLAEPGPFAAWPRWTCLQSHHCLGFHHPLLSLQPLLQTSLTASGFGHRALMPQLVGAIPEHPTVLYSDTSVLPPDPHGSQLGLVQVASAIGTRSAPGRQRPTAPSPTISDGTLPGRLR